MGCSKFKNCISSLEKNSKKENDCSTTECLLAYDSRKIVTVEEKKKKYELENPNEDKIASFRIDGGMISSPNEVKCDHLLVDTASKTAVFVELKGTDLKHAFEQVEVTMAKLLSGLQNYRIFARIVTSHRTNVPNIKTCPQYISLNKKIMGHGGNIIARAEKISESVANI